MLFVARIRLYLFAMSEAPRIRAVSAEVGLYGTVSAHAAISFSIALFTSVLFRRRWYAIAIFVWAALLAYSRIYLGVHYPMDILFGLLLGLSLAAVSVRLCLRRMRRTEEVSPGSSEKDAL